MIVREIVYRDDDDNVIWRVDHGSLWVTDLSVGDKVREQGIVYRVTFLVHEEEAEKLFATGSRVRSAGNGC